MGNLCYDLIELINDYALGTMNDYDAVVAFNAVFGYTLEDFYYTDKYKYAKVRYERKKRSNIHELCAKSNELFDYYIDILYTNFFTMYALFRKIRENIKCYHTFLIENKRGAYHNLQIYWYINRDWYQFFNEKCEYQLVNTINIDEFRDKNYDAHDCDLIKLYNKFLSKRTKNNIFNLRGKRAEYNNSYFISS